MKRAVVLLSGGIDSTTTLAIARHEGYDVYAMSLDYHQRQRVELEVARRNAERFKVVEHVIIEIDLSSIARSALTSDIEVPKDRDVQRLREIPVTYVPARNVIFLSLALAWAETIGSGDIFIGANAIDYSGYPDCRPEFLRAYEEMANLAMKASVEGRMRFRIHAPLINMSKAEIIRKGYELGVDFSDTWSCYDPQERGALSYTSAVTHHGYVPCGRCDSCLLREKGFREAGIEDPLKHEVKY
jgi:7-cyano-7-deazaguanine synthase